MAVFYYAGHGLELDDGLNYLAPVDFSASYGVNEAKFWSLSADLVQARMAEAGARTRGVILDACRTNPFGPRLGTLTRGGLGQLSPQGGMVAYATEPRKAAADDGLYARHLVADLQVPGLPATEVFTRVSEAVEAASGGTQVPMQQIRHDGSAGRGQERPARRAAGVLPAGHGLGAAVIEVSNGRQVPFLHDESVGGHRLPTGTLTKPVFGAL